ncbi:uncharacterized protein LOC107146991 isoform X3 [Marmota marmota marmota]|uniref:uncharacterized protein LOC107146991 isoform X3 n=1 Tax=Marmota marmota marmota TaxID=9994 RepID=UPI002093CE41|nr:uncharacterized protein LOC107146991 isoform X3 [Marmota marmota marmota]
MEENIYKENAFFRHHSSFRTPWTLLGQDPSNWRPNQVTEELQPLFDILKGDSNPHSSRILTEEAKLALNKDADSPIWIPDRLIRPYVQLPDQKAEQIMPSKSPILPTIDHSA